MMESKHWVVVGIVLCGATLAFFGLHHQALSLISGYVMDDSYITLRYAHNLIQTGQLTWNKGHVPAEGFTSVVWVICASLFIAMGIDPLTGLQVTAAVSLAGALVLLLLTLQRLVIKDMFTTWILPSIVALLLVSNRDMVIHLFSGMETMLALFFWAVHFYCLSWFYLPERNRNRDGMHLFVWSLICVVATLNRPEFALVALASFLLAGRVGNISWKKLILQAYVPYVLAGVMDEIWRWIHFHQWLPLPFYIKVSHDSLPGLQVAWNYMREYGVVLLLAASGLILPSSRRRVAGVLLLAGILYASLLIVAPIMDVGDRYLFPLWPAWLLALALTMAEIHHRLKKVWVDVGVVCLSLLLTYFLHRPNMDEIQSLHDYAMGLNQAHIALGKALHSMGTQHSIALGDAGSVPYFSDWYAVDTYGLNSNEVALGRWHHHYPDQVIMSREPDVLVLISSSGHTLATPDEIAYEQLLYRDALERNYHFIGLLRFNSGYYLWLYGRNSNLEQQVKHRIEAEKLTSFSPHPLPAAGS
ncbi:MAG: hypothetical protein HKM02_03900 [Pseudomonadales bacterium]|nr:hypothetical protein [Pseudomonadales bacterium]